MSNYNLIISDFISLELKVKHSSRIALNFMLGTVIVMGLIPVLVFVFIILPEEDGIPLGFFIACLLVAFPFFYLLRLYLWNKYGKEVFIIKRNSLYHYYNYKFFTDNKKDIEFKRLEVFFLTKKRVPLSIFADYKNKDRLSLICFCLDDQVLESEVELPIYDIINIGKRLQRI